MRPASNHIFLESTDKPVTSLIIPPKYERKARTYNMGRVIAKGPKVTQVEIGDEVAYDKEHSIEVEISQRKHIVIKPKCIAAVV